MSRLQLAELTAFIAVAEHLSFTKAAVQIGVALPTMSQTIRSFEERLGVRLAEAEKTIASTREAAMSNVRGIAADAATAIVQRLTGTVPDSASVGQAVDASLKG